MWLRAALSVVWFAMLLFALALLDCSSPLIGDPFGVCPDLGRLDIPDPLVVASVVSGISLVGLVAVWLPYLSEQSRQRRLRPERKLLENIGRLPEPYSNYATADGIGPDSISELRKAVEVVETAFATDSSATRSMTSEWMRLLLEANRLHNDGSLPTEDFKELNTRLLEAVTAPSPSSSV